MHAWSISSLRRPNSSLNFLMRFMALMSCKVGKQTGGSKMSFWTQQGTGISRHSIMLLRP
ncbi:hypothetical protein FOFC_17333 [Fusarium oxysporum]|nr:hypothetical protein FOFC_17333 [Fusarium oxysporum]